MKPVSHPSNTRTLGAPAGWDQSGLPVDALGITDQLVEGVPCVWSFWEPDAEELAAIAAGGKVILSVVGRTMPPALLLVSTPAVMPAASGDAVHRVLAERRRQVSAEGWTPEHDAREHDSGELAAAAAAYALAAAGALALQAMGMECDSSTPPACWPTNWDWKPASAERMLEKAAALILAELERVDGEKMKKAKR